jgi:pimeloyl-ACP methyl ester carboxylesterase
MIKHFNYNNANIAYRTEGEGKVVVLLHGFGEDGTIFNEQINFLKNYCRLIVPDLPGSGQSAMLEDTTNEISIEDYARCIYALLQHEEIVSYIMLGHSMGGYITLSFAKLFPQQLTGFGLIHSTAFADSDEKKQTRLRGIELMENYGGYSFLKNIIPNLFAQSFKEKHPEKVDAFIEQGKYFTTQALQQYYRAMMNRADTTFVLKNNPLPVLFITGSEDIAAPLKDVLQQKHLPLCSSIYILNPTGPIGLWEAADDVNQYLLNFIEAI